MTVHEGGAGTVRPARLGDATAIGEISVAAWRWAYRGIIEPGYLAGLDAAERAQDWVEILRTPPARSAVLILEAYGAVVGFAAVGPSEDAEVGQVHSIYLRPENTRQGLGAELLGACEQRLRSSGFSEAVLWTLPDNIRAHRFYEARGWNIETVTRRSKEGGIDLDQVRFRRALEPAGSSD